MHLYFNHIEELHNKLGTGDEENEIYQLAKAWEWQGKSITRVVWGTAPCHKDGKVLHYPYQVEALGGVL